MKLKTSILVILIIMLLFIIIYLSKQKISPEPLPIKDIPNKKSSVIDWDSLSDGEKIQYIADTYFNVVPPPTGEDQQTIMDDNYINSLTYDSTCDSDLFKECPNWASDGECEINPEYMLYNCTKSCKACKLTAENKAKLTQIYNTRSPKHCVYHGTDYPGEFKYLNNLYEYAFSY